MPRTLRPDQFKVFDGKKTWFGEDILKFFKFNPAKCQIEVRNNILTITQEGGLDITLCFWEEIK